MLASLFNKIATSLKNEVATLLKETPALVFSCEIYKIFKNTYFEEQMQATASGRRTIAL